MCVFYPGIPITTVSDRLYHRNSPVLVLIVIVVVVVVVAAAAVVAVTAAAGVFSQTVYKP